MFLTYFLLFFIDNPLMEEFEILKNLLHSTADVGKCVTWAFFCSILYRCVMTLLIEKRNVLTKTFLLPLKIYFSTRYLRKTILKQFVLVFSVELFKLFSLHTLFFRNKFLNKEIIFHKPLATNKKSNTHFLTPFEYICSKCIKTSIWTTAHSVS